MPSTTSSSVAMLLASSTVITPSLPTFCMASAIIWPTSRSPLAEMVPTWAISALVETFFERFLTSSTTASTAMSTPRFRSIGFMPAATPLGPQGPRDGAPDPHAGAALQLHRVHAGGDRLGPLAHDRLGQHRRGGGAVAGEIAGLGGHLLDHLGAHVLELIGEFDVFRHRHAILGDARRAERLVEHDVAALGAARHADGVGQKIGGGRR